MNHFFLIIAFLAFMSASGLAQPALLYEDNLEDITFLPRERDIQYPPLQGIYSLNHDNVMKEYTRVLECSQLVSRLSTEMEKRLNETVPPPHHHCFIWERNLSQLHSLNHNTTQGLCCDQHMLSHFPSALQRAAVYEGLHFQNQETMVILKVRTMLQNILTVLSNLTGSVINETTTMGPEDLEVCGAPRPILGGEGEGEGEEGTEELSTGREEAYRTDGYTGDQSGTRTDDEESGNRPPHYNPASSQGHQQTNVESSRDDTTPTSPTPTRCNSIADATDQFIYITELRYALYYLSLDLKQKSYCS